MAAAARAPTTLVRHSRRGRPLVSGSSSSSALRRGRRAARGVLRRAAPAAAVALSNKPNPPRTRAELLWAAAKLPIYSVALVPVCVGTAAAYASTGAWCAGRFATVMLSSCAVIAWLNLSNDGHDAETGVDAKGAKPESVVNLFGGARTVLVVAYSLLALGLVGLMSVAARAGDARVAAFLILAVACGYVYQCPPFRLSYKGLGEPLCFAAFGPLATTAFYYAAAAGDAPVLILPQVTAAAAVAACLVGATTTAILLTSHFHQIEGDARAGKRSPVVRLGTRRAADALTAGVLLAHALAAAACATGAAPLAVGLAALAASPLAMRLVAFVRHYHARPDVVFRAKFLAVRWHVALGAALTAALAIA